MPLSRRPVGDSNGRRSAGFLERQTAGFTGKLPAAAIITGDEWLPLVNAATHNNNPELHVLSHAWFKALPEADVALQRPVPNDIAYLQYTSGSTRFPRGVIITHHEVMANLRAISTMALNYALATAASPGCLSTMIWDWSAFS